MSIEGEELKERSVSMAVDPAGVSSIDISSRADYPACALSNFTAHQFAIDGVMCCSMEGFLQALKFSNPVKQAEVCRLVGVRAKRRGRGKVWQREGQLYWHGEEFDRYGEAYQKLLNRAFMALYNQAVDFRQALRATGCAAFTYASGKREATATVLTQVEFIERLVMLRNRLREAVEPCKEVWERFSQDEYEAEMLKMASCDKMLASEPNMLEFREQIVEVVYQVEKICSFYCLHMGVYDSLEEAVEKVRELGSEATQYDKYLIRVFVLYGGVYWTRSQGGFSDYKNNGTPRGSDVEVKDSSRMKVEVRQSETRRELQDCITGYYCYR